MATQTKEQKEEARRAALTQEERDAEDAKASAEKAEADRVAAEKAEADRVAAEKAEADRVAAEKAAKKNKASVTVVWRAGSRVYSRAVHGDDFEALAAEFAAKKLGRIV